MWHLHLKPKKVLALHNCGGNVLPCDLQDLRSKLEKAESVLKLAEMCRKLETEQEKVIPFWSITAVSATAAGQEADDGILDEQQQAILKGIHQQQQQEDAAGSPVAGTSRTAAGQQQQAKQQEEAQHDREGESVSPSAASNQLRLSAVGLDDSGKEVEEWDYLNK